MMLLNRILTTIETKLRQEQAGFRKSSGYIYIDQIFTLRNIMNRAWNGKLPSL